jgi:hypothetical protein
MDSLANALGSSFEKKAERERAQADLQAKLEHERQAEIDKEQRLRERRQQELETAKGLMSDPKYKGMSVDVGDVSVRPQGESLMDMLKLQALNAEREDRAKERASEKYAKSGVAPMQQSVQRLLGVSPKALEGEYKSVGGIKNLAPDWSVGPLEKIGLFPKGASEERSALADVTNTKIYDSTGKQINEAESKRIMQSLGLKGLTEPKAIQQALQQMGMTAITRAKTIEAGVRPNVRQQLEEEGVPTSRNLESLFKPAAVNPKRSADGASVADRQQGSAPSMSREEFKRLRMQGK